jgi:hypothetical protein
MVVDQSDRPVAATQFSLATPSPPAQPLTVRRDKFHNGKAQHPGDPAQRKLLDRLLALVLEWLSPSLRSAGRPCAARAVASMPRLRQLPHPIPGWIGGNRVARAPPVHPPRLRQQPASPIRHPRRPSDICNWDRKQPGPPSLSAFSTHHLASEWLLRFLLYVPEYM